ncbi:hypothetical protein WKW79_29920 [Variovorax robiniae]|uniref:Uncharacterized protein n=1 Tax=Variovorax robiniae TaxID=1836199 RepID=A0ABU8XG87_9BURK
MAETPKYLPALRSNVCSERPLRDAAAAAGERTYVSFILCRRSRHVETGVLLRSLAGRCVSCDREAVARSIGKRRTIVELLARIA